MGTRSITSVYDMSWQEIPVHVVSIYRHSDGYPEGHGRDLLEFLKGRALVNGYSSETPKPFANGVDNLAAQLIAFLENENHNPCIQPEGAICGQEFHYVVTGDSNKGTLKVEVLSGPMTAFGMGGERCNEEVFAGNVSEYTEWLDRRAHEED